MKDFFSKIDAQIVKQQKIKSEVGMTKEQNEVFFSNVVQRLTPVLEEYVQQLTERKIKVTHLSKPTYMSIELKYRDGGHYCLSLGTNITTGRIEFTKFFTSDDGKNYTSTDGISYTGTTWDDSIFTKQIENLIQDFVYYADRHQGF
ncbi:hypothetical protein E0H86_11525 [Acinetobacter sp. ANC 4635]|uniref:hypothetical protein n=1 Tax=Acinetobacter sp. ANC 4635 TaxID=2529846 RepID=UPI00103FEEF8|nr:hypothetical protein [Acinetobacter sp. ANC 4635]TCB28437.1 hypothetical protein E0H86_11525 [Acinetobacter sp. ANC 4635]